MTKNRLVRLDQDADCVLPSSALRNVLSPAAQDESRQRVCETLCFPHACRQPYSASVLWQPTSYHDSPRKFGSAGRRKKRISVAPGGGPVSRVWGGVLFASAARHVSVQQARSGRCSSRPTCQSRREIKSSHETSLIVGLSFTFVGPPWTGEELPVRTRGRGSRLTF